MSTNGDVVNTATCSIDARFYSKLLGKDQGIPPHGTTTNCYKPRKEQALFFQQVF